MMQSPNGDPSHAIRTLGDGLKVALVVLALLATALNIGPKRWDENDKRLTTAGYIAIITAVLVAVVGVASWWTDKWTKKLDGDASAQAVKQQEARDEGLLSQLQTENRILKVHRESLDEANSALKTGLSIAMRQLPVDEIQLRFKREQIEAALPPELKRKNFSFRKPLGEQNMGSFDANSMFITFNIMPVQPLNFLHSYQVGKEALDSFESVSRGICRIEITPSSIGGSIFRLSIGSDYYLTGATLDRQFLSYTFSPDNLPAAYFDDTKAHLEIQLEAGELPKSQPCVTPRDLQLKIRSFRFVADTGFVDAGWKREYHRSVGLSGMLKFEASEAKDQPAPAK